MFLNLFDESLWDEHRTCIKLWTDYFFSGMKSIKFKSLSQMTPIQSSNCTRIISFKIQSISYASIFSQRFMLITIKRSKYNEKDFFQKGSSFFFVITQRSFDQQCGINKKTNYLYIYECKKSISFNFFLFVCGCSFREKFCGFESNNEFFFFSHF